MRIHEKFSAGTAVNRVCVALCERIGFRPTGRQRTTLLKKVKGSERIYLFASASLNTSIYKRIKYNVHTALFVDFCQRSNLKMLKCSQTDLWW